MRIAVHGKPSLSGDYYPSGNGNAAVATIAAALMSSEQVKLENVPHSHSVTKMLNVAEQLGTTIQAENSTLQLETPHIQSRVLENEITEQLSAGILFLAPILARRRYARLEWLQPMSRLYPHLTALRDLGLLIETDGNAVNITAEPWDYAEVVLTWPSVTATNLVAMLAATLGKKTVIYNAACEPHVRTVQLQLVQMGANIEGIGSNLLTIHGLHGEDGKEANVTLPFDHVEIASIATIAAITGGQVAIHNIYPPDLNMILKVFERLGMQFYLQRSKKNTLHTLHIPQQDTLIAQPFADNTVSVDTAAWPGFPSDLVAITTVLASQVRGTSLIHERLYNNRLLFVDKLKAMGAKILLCDPHRAIVIGKSPLRGEYIDSPDVRVGMALLAAALCADGESVIDNADLIERHFANVTDKLNQLGANIQELPYD